MTEEEEDNVNVTSSNPLSNKKGVIIIMKASAQKTKLVSTDVLIIGGSIAGLTAAVKIKKLNERIDVVVLDKGGIGWAGEVPTGGGFCITVPPEVNLDEWVKWVADRGEGLSNIDWLYNFGGSVHEVTLELFNWGLAFMKHPDGKLFIDDIPSWRVKNKAVGYVPHKVLLQLKKMALGKGAKMLNKIEMVDLLKYDGRIVGAVGFSILTGEYYVFKAKATLIASGSTQYKNRRLWTMNCGEMVTAAYRAGARLLNSEFGALHSNCSKECGAWWRGAAHQDALVNALGEPIIKKYFPTTTAESYWKQAYAMVREIDAGRGPIYVDVRGIPLQHEEPGEGVFKWTARQGIFYNPERIIMEKGGIDVSKEKVEWIPGFLGGLGNIQVDLECKSPDLEGLWIAGNAIKTGIDMEGAVPPGEYGGWGLPLAHTTGMKAGKSIARIVSEMPKPKIDKEQQESLKERLFAPLTGKRKEFGHFEAFHKIQQAFVPYKYCFIRTEERLKESLAMIDEIQKEVLPKMKVENPHELLKYHEAASMALSAEMTQRAALHRTETRGGHIREDYPERDDKNWLKWTVIKEEDGRMALSTKPVPKSKS